ncbi:hypothetical protein SNE40_008034 [Patella caerulea]|uniref:Enhancer of mRNA-decapping protein 4 C-terminal domain-containing protein n=1 Tax=Patella caerulea TaxID=87958 RepID=A0AAN8JUW5_PATCE
MEVRHKEEQLQLHGSIIETVGTSVSQGLDKSVRAEIKQSLLPCVSQTLQPIKEQHQHELSQKLTATDSLLKDNIAKMVRSKQTVEAIGQAAGNAIQAPIQAAYREAFQNMVVPSFERASQNLFKQLNDSFQRGTREYTSNLENHLEQVRKRQLEARDPVIGQLQSMVDSFRQSSESLQTQILSTLKGELTSHLNASSELMQEKLLQQVRTAVKEEVSLAVREHGASISSQLMNHLRSGAATPIQVSPEFVSNFPTQSSVLALLHAGKINEAFQQALSAANLDLVVFVCQKADVGSVFSQSNILDQPVLLSLIQQLSADLTTHSELKIQYLTEAIMNLDTKNPVTRDHMKTVLHTLLSKLKAFIVNRPNDQITRNVRMVQMATQSLLNV